MKTLGEVDYTNLLPHIEALTENPLGPKCRNLAKIIFLLAKNHMHIFIKFITFCAKFQIDCLKTLGEVDYTNLLPHIEALTENPLGPKCRNLAKIIFLLAKNHMHIFIKFITFCAKFQIDCLKTLGGVDYTNLLPYVEG